MTKISVGLALSLLLIGPLSKAAIYTLEFPADALNSFSTDKVCRVSNSKKNVSSLAEVGMVMREQQYCSRIVASIPGESSHYGNGDGFNGKKGFCGETFKSAEMTVAFPAGKVARPGTTPKPGQVACGTIIRITNKANGRSAFARVTDTGGFAKYGRIVDSSGAVAKKLGFLDQGKAKVTVDICAK